MAGAGIPRGIMLPECLPPRPQAQTGKEAVHRVSFAGRAGCSCVCTGPTRDARAEKTANGTLSDRTREWGCQLAHLRVATAGGGKHTVREMTPTLFHNRRAGRSFSKLKYEKRRFG